MTSHEGRETPRRVRGGRVAGLRRREAVLAARVAERERHMAELGALQGQTAELLRQLRADLEGEIARRREALEEREGEVREAVRELAALQGEVAGLRGDAAELQSTAEVLGREREAQEGRLRALEGATVEAERGLAALRVSCAGLERREQELAAVVSEWEQRRDALVTEVAGLNAARDELRESFRPLRPYIPPLGRLRLATVEMQVNAKLQRQDATALRLYAQQSGMEMRRVVMEALRNYLPAESYEEALRVIEGQAREGLEPEMAEVQGSE